MLSINRVTGVFLVAAYWLAVWPRVRGWGVLYALLWGGVTLAVRGIAGDGDNPHTLAYIWHYNLSTWGASVFALAALFGAWWGLVPRAVWRARGFTARLMALVGLYLVPFAVFGVWHETRLLTWAIPVVVLAILQNEQREHHDTDWL